MRKEKWKKKLFNATTKLTKVLASISFAEDSLDGKGQKNLTTSTLWKLIIAINYSEITIVPFWIIKTYKLGV